ncbi:MAG: ComEC/Rec2 family competence protein [Cuspidothrix sp.]
MTCEFVFLPVGNADSIIIYPDGGSAVVIDLHKIPLLRKWFQNKNQTNISRIYITHEHRDHFPSLEDLVTFLETWLKTGTIGSICLPYEVYKDARKKVADGKGNELLKDALLRLKYWEKKNIINFIEVTRGSNPYSQDSLEIHALHPGLLYAQDHLANTGGKDNEISVVLRVTYGDFAALLLADIEGAGLKECVDLSITNPTEFIANLVKIPHHGAWPKNGDDLQQLLETINPEIAVLSVGSTNRYGHVVPELFNLLLNLQNDNSKQLKQFVCTEVTRTCVKSASDRSSMGKSGLTAQQLCAGEITILAETSGKWTLKTQTDHKNVISSLPYPACQCRADLGAVST